MTLLTKAELDEIEDLRVWSFDHGLHSGVINSALKRMRIHIDELVTKRDEAHETAKLLWDALMWLDTFSPEDTAAVEEKFNLDISARAVLQKGEADG